MARKTPEDAGPPDQLPALIEAAIHHLRKQLKVEPTVSRVSSDEFTLVVSNERVRMTGTFAYRGDILHFENKHLWVDGREIEHPLGHLVEIFNDPDRCGFVHQANRLPDGQHRFDPRVHNPVHS